MKNRGNLIESLAKEMGSADLGDQRRSKRLAEMVGKIAQGPDRSFPDIFTDPAQLSAAYRFFSNPEVGHEAILTSHVLGTVTRAKERGTVLVVHDTTELSFGGESRRQGMGRLRTSGQGFYAHVGLVLDADGSREPLGLAGIRTVFRQEKKGHRTAAQRRQDPENESRRWSSLALESDGLLRGQAAAIHLMDREGDSYPLLSELTKASLRFVVRLCHDRMLEGDNGERGGMLQQEVSSTPFIAEREVPLSLRGRRGRTAQQQRIHPPRQMRLARLRFSALSVKLRRPNNYPKESLPDSLSINVVRVKEVDAPAGVAPIEWLLATTEPVETPQDILRVVDWYRARWVIEEFNKALKTGCAFEARQLETQHALLNALALLAPIACLLLRIRSLARTAPTQPAAPLFPPLELTVLRAMAPVPLSDEPTVQEVLAAIARLGGHLKRNGPPGWLVLFRGYKKLQAFAQGWAAAMATAQQKM